MNKIYGVFYYTKNGEPQLLREFRSYKAALLHKLDMIDRMNDLNFCIKVRYLSDWKDLDDGVE